MGMTIDYELRRIQEQLADISAKFRATQSIYEARLKADMVAMLTEIDMELDELTPPESSTNYYSHGIIDAQVIIQKKIDALKEA